MTQGSHAVVLDSGGSTCKLGLAGQVEQVQVFPNCTAKVKGERHVLVGEDVLSAKDVSSLQLRRPVDRGYVVAWDIQKEVWARALRSLLGGSSTQASACTLLLTEPYFNLPALREAALQVLFGELGVSAVLMAPPAALALRWHAHLRPDLPACAAGCGLVVDSGFSFTHAVPVFDWAVLPEGIRRIDLGGKALTNYMKEIVSYRSINMHDEAYLLEHIKDALCFVSADPVADLAAARRRDSPFRREWLLPDGVTSTWGHVRDPGDPRGPKDPILMVNNERFMVPEALFHPTDLGMDEAGLAETIVEAVQATHPHLHGLLYSNVVVSGGTARCPGFRDRLQAELRPLVPDDYEVNVFVAGDDPALSAWRGGALLAASPEGGRRAVTRQEWKAHGMAACAKWEA